MARDVYKLDVARFLLLLRHRLKPGVLRHSRYIERSGRKNCACLYPVEYKQESTCTLPPTPDCTCADSAKCETSLLRSFVFSHLYLLTGLVVSNSFYHYVTFGTSFALGIGARRLLSGECWFYWRFKPSSGMVPPVLFREDSEAGSSEARA